MGLRGEAAKPVGLPAAGSSAAMSVEVACGFGFEGWEATNVMSVRGCGFASARGGGDERDKCVGGHYDVC